MSSSSLLTSISVNEIFDPLRVDNFYNGTPDARTNALKADRSTNYSVVRLELLEQIYHDLYQQRIKQADESKWQHRILSSRQITNISPKKGGEKLLLTIKDIDPLRTTTPHPSNGDIEHEKSTTLEVDAILVATGYDRNDVHKYLLKDCQHLFLPTPRSTDDNDASTNHTHVRRDYKVSMDESKVVPNAGIWLQGCNEATHGLSDTLLSTLATRGGEIVTSIFGNGIGGLDV